MKNIRYVFNILFSLIVIGSVLILSSVKSTSAGYGFNLFGLLGILFVNVMFISKENTDASIFTLIKKIIFNNFPMVALIGVIAWLFTQNIIHQKKIVKRHTPVEYNKFLTLSSILNVFLFGVIYVILDDNYKQLEGLSQSVMKNKQLMSNIFLLLLAIQYCLAIFQHIILTYYSTDG